MKTLRIYFDFNGASSRYMHRLCDQFEAKEGIRLLRTEREIHSLTRLLCDSQSLPEMALLPSDMIALADKLHFSPIPESWPCPAIPELCSATLQQEGIQLGLPLLAGNHLLQFYDKRRGEPLQEWQQLLTSGEKAWEGWCCGIDFEEPYWLIPFLLRFFGWPIGQKSLHLNSPAMSHALQYRQQLQRRGRLRHYHYNGALCAALRHGEVPAIITGEWEYANLQAALGEHLGVAPLPQIDGLPCRSFFSTIGLVFPGMSLQGPHAALLQRFAQWLLTPEVQQGWQDQAQRQPVREDLATAMTDQERATISHCIDDCCVMPSHPLMNRAWQAMAHGLKGCQNLPLHPPGRLGQKMQHFVQSPLATEPHHE